MGVIHDWRSPARPPRRWLTLPLPADKAADVRRFLDMVASHWGRPQSAGAA